MIINGRKVFQFTIDLNSLDRDELAQELVKVLNQEANMHTCPRLFQLLSVVETVEHGATGGLDVSSDSRDAATP